MSSEAESKCSRLRRHGKTQRRRPARRKRRRRGKTRRDGMPSLVMALPRCRSGHPTTELTTAPFGNLLADVADRLNRT